MSRIHIDPFDKFLSTKGRGVVAVSLLSPLVVRVPSLSWHPYVLRVFHFSQYLIAKGRGAYAANQHTYLSREKKRNYRFRERFREKFRERLRWFTSASISSRFHLSSVCRRSERNRRKRKTFWEIFEHHLVSVVIDSHIGRTKRKRKRERETARPIMGMSRYWLYKQFLSFIR